MEDRFVWRYGGGDYIVIDGSRKGPDRRTRNDRRGSVAKGIFAVNVLDQRRCFERRQLRDRRIEDRTYSVKRLSHWPGMMSLGVFLWITGVFFLVLGLVFSQTMGAALGVFFFIGGIFIILMQVHKRRKNEVNQ